MWVVLKAGITQKCLQRRWQQQQQGGSEKWRAGMQCRKAHLQHTKTSAG